MLASPAALKSVSHLALRSSERRAPAAGRRSWARLRFKQPAVRPRSSSIACAMSTRLGACSALCRGGGGATSRATRGVTCGSTPALAGSHRHTHGAAERS
eukprot:12276629-Alexandrium_andersonii.AAC.1